MRLAALGCCAIAACASPPPPAAPAIDPAVLGDAAFDPVAADAPWQPHERATLRVELHEGDRVREWSIALDVLAPPTEEFRVTGVRYSIDDERVQLFSQALQVATLVRERGSERLEADTSMIPELFLRRGFFDLAEETLRLSGGDGEFSEEEGAALSKEARHQYAYLFVQGVGGLAALLQVVQRSESLSDVLWAVVRKPSWLSVLFRGGSVELSIDADFSKAERVASGLPPPLDGLPAYAIPIELTLNGSPALACRMIACPPGPPLRLLGGIVRLEGVHPDHPQRRVVVSVVGGRLGGADEGPPEPDRPR